MKIIRPLPTLCQHIISYNVPQTIPIWSSTVSYAKDAQVVLDDCGAIVYQSLISTNLNNPPATSPLAWVAVGVSNRFAMFDNKNGTQTVYADTITVEIEITSLVNSVSLVNVYATEARFEVWDSSNIKLVDITVPLLDFGVSDWYEYFFKEIDNVQNYVNFELPSLLAGRGKLTLNNIGSEAKLGSLVYGNQFEIGKTEWGVALGIRDYSTKEVDDFGNYLIIPRAFSDTIEADVVIESQRVAHVRKVLSQYRATPLVWVGSTDYEATVTHGYFKDFQINLNNHLISDCTISIEGLT